MKIVIDAREYSTSTGRYIRKLIEYLEELDSTHKFVILLRSQDFESYQPKNPRFSKLKADFKEFTFAEQIGFNTFLRQLKPDLVHFGMVQQPVLYNRLKVTTMHDLTTVRFRNPAKNAVVFTIKQWVYNWVNKKVARDSAAILTPSQFVKQDVAAFTKVDLAKITVTNESADKIKVAPESIVELRDQPFIMYIGNPHAHKNLKRLIDAFAQLKKTRPALKLVLAGKKSALYESYLRYSTKCGIEGVVLTGFVSEGQLRWLYEHCSAYVFPSLSEGFGLPGLEAMAHGAPVVSSNATCLPEIYEEAACYFDPLSGKDMANSIEKVISNEKLRQKLIKNGYALLEQYSWKKMATETLAVYEDILRK